MLSVKKISLVHFRNYESKEFSFSKRIVCIHGANGSGKTTLLDALYYLCFTKSYFQHMDSLSVKQGETGMRIEGIIEDKKINTVTCILRENGRKEFSLNDEPYSQFSKHIGKFPCVFIAPDDTSLISEGSETRRKFLDTMISQTNSQYMQYLISYSRYLQQRNTLLKQWADNVNKDFALLSVYNQQMNESGHAVFTIRKEYCEKFKEKVNDIYSYISGEKEEIVSVYSSQLLHESLIDLLEKNVDKDIITQRTNYGIHKDDLLFTLHDLPLKQTASQGQRKSFLFALKLAQYELIKEITGKHALLLLDDIFEKLDEQRNAKLIHYILNLHSQVFITDTHEDRLREAFRDNTAIEFIGLS